MRRRGCPASPPVQHTGACAPWDRLGRTIILSTFRAALRVAPATKRARIQSPDPQSRTTSWEFLLPRGGRRSTLAVDSASSKSIPFPGSPGLRPLSFNIVKYGEWVSVPSPLRRLRKKWSNGRASVLSGREIGAKDMKEVLARPERPSQRGIAALKTTVVVCTRHRNEELKASLSALRMMHALADQILVIDNSSGDPEAERIASMFQADYVIEPNVGLSHARNRGFMESSSEIVFFLDDDATPERSWLQEMLPLFDDPQVGLVTGRITAGTQILTPPGDCTWRISREHPHWLEIAAFGGLGSGANMAIRKSACGNNHPFDERLGSGAPFEQGEENFAFAKLIKQGIIAVHVPTAIVYHPNKELKLEPFAARSLAFWLLLLEEFPRERGILIRYLWSRIRRIPLSWPRNPQQPGVVISAGWPLYLRAGLRGALLYLRHRRSMR